MCVYTEVGHTSSSLHHHHYCFHLKIISDDAEQVCLRHRSRRVYLVTVCKSVFKFQFNKLEKCSQFSQNAKKKIRS